MRRLTVDGIEKAFGDRRILRGCGLKLDDGERVGLVGANGSGKTTLMRILAGEESPDHGAIHHHGRMAWLNQDPHIPGETVGDAIEDALSWHHELTESYTAALEAGELAEAGVIQDRLDLVGWDLTHQADAVLDRVAAPPREAPTDRLSGGERRRVALARALLAGADLLLLDEPTNHLDVETVTWLEGYLESFRGAVVIVTHDRYLLERVATRIVEIEDGVTVGYEGSYGDYLITRAERQSRLARSEQRRSRLIAQEAAWAARSPAARSTKQKARLQRLDALMGQEGWSEGGELVLDMRTGDSFGGTLLDVQGISKGFGDRTLIKNLSFSVSPRDRLGIVGPNGAGKSTLLKMLLGSLEPDEGSMMRASRVRVGLLDQERTGLNDSETVYEAAGGGGEFVRVGDQQIHVTSFLNRFLFSREHYDQQVGKLSGGERARLLMARLLLQGANLLMLDEPTNDLDLMTLRVLEDALLSYDGGVIVVT
ncbi:MAG: ATP-binding cassette subfamily F protein uup, partial [Myxococcota bacterium]